MKRGLKIFIIVLSLFGVFILFLFFNNLQYFLKINGEIIGNITGKASSQITHVGITVLSGVNISIISPKNETYFNILSIPLNYSVSGEQSVWYSLDSGINTTLTAPTFLSVSNGGHSFFLYANSSAGDLETQNISFFVNSSIFNIIDEELSGAKKGSSTNFSILSYEEVQNLSNITLENTDFGKILFNQNINMTADADFSDNQVDLDLNINISSNRIELNSTALPNFNKIATLWLYGLTFSNPRVLIGGEACPSAVCQKESYSGGILKFNVTSFLGNFSAGETPSETAATTTTGGSSGGGGGGGGIVKPQKVKSFSVNKKEIKASLTPGSVSTEKIIVKNNLNKTINISLEKFDSIKDFLAIEEKEIELGPKESKEILIDFKVREAVIPDLYMGKIIVKGEGTEEEILVVLEVESEGALLDVKMDIFQEFLNIFNSKEIIAEIKLFNVGEAGNRKDITINYIIKDSDGNEIMNDGETVSLETETSQVKRLTLPDSIKSGKYILYIKAITDEGKIASASESFEIIKISKERIYIVAALIIITILGIVLYFLKRRKGLTNKLKSKLTLKDITNKRR